MSTTAGRALPARDGNDARLSSWGSAWPPGRAGTPGGGPCWMKGGAGRALRPAGPGRGFSGAAQVPAPGAGLNG
jgi:hypothetical protein